MFIRCAQEYFTMVERLLEDFSTYSRRGSRQELTNVTDIFREDHFKARVQPMKNLTIHRVSNDESSRHLYRILPVAVP